MKHKLAWHSSFRRAFKKAVKSNPDLEEKIFSALERMVFDPFDPILKTHKLHGKLSGLWACYVEYDCRVIFTFELSLDKKNYLIVLVDIGKHDEVY